MATEYDHDGAPAPERRSFLGVISGLIVAGISAALGVTIGRYSISPAFSTSNEQDWTDLGSLDEFAEGKLVKKNVIVSQDAGWGKFQTQRSVWVVKKGESAKVFSGVCPHLGCSVNSREDKFICACHGSEWDVEGARVAGPTPRGLDTLELRVEENKLKVKYQDFKQGLTSKEVLS
ncbi:MAG TPA: Rieske 2Fe-2S domain-containing protein [Blastocatellia bacterium]|jgi:Rieske Fe-S protein|nr:Rieske 2Fe-2S domain-containing protein [Blastocatellia bacterium]